jgi:hypothetical protein
MKKQKSYRIGDLVLVCSSLFYSSTSTVLQVATITRMTGSAVEVEFEHKTFWRTKRERFWVINSNIFGRVQTAEAL